MSIPAPASTPAPEQPASDSPTSEPTAAAPNSATEKVNIDDLVSQFNKLTQADQQKILSALTK